MTDHLADRIRRILHERKTATVEKKMMGGICFMVNDKMCMGVVKDRLMARVGPDNYAQALKRKGCREMDFTGRPMNGYVFVDGEGTDFDTDLKFWVDLCLAFNPQAKSSKVKSK